jgi:hypothetical protein
MLKFLQTLFGNSGGFVTKNPPLDVAEQTFRCPNGVSCPGCDGASVPKVWEQASYASYSDRDEVTWGKLPQDLRKHLLKLEKQGVTPRVVDYYCTCRQCNAGFKIITFFDPLSNDYMWDYVPKT